jgi:EpsI family protein
MDQPYDQTVMRTYVNSRGQQVMLAIAWGKRQRQEVKIHRPELCYVSQGFKVESLVPVRFNSIHGADGQPISGKHMFAQKGAYGEVVSYWIRIGDLFSENAFETRMRIFQAGLHGIIPDGILVRASARIADRRDVGAIYPVLDSFLADLVKAVPDRTRLLLLGSDDMGQGERGAS